MKQNKILVIILLCSINCFSQRHYPIRGMLGVNVHPWDLAAHPQEQNPDIKTARLQNAIISTNFSWLRLYADAWAYKSDDNTTFMFNPQRNGYMPDSAIIALKKENPNIKTDFCYQNQPKNIQAEWQTAGHKSTQYRHWNTDVTNPATWAEAAKDMAVITARGGTNKTVADYPLFVSQYWWEPKQVMIKGSGMYDQVETGNEWDMQYSNDNVISGKFEDKPAITGSQYAVPWKASYDAIKKVDPNISVSTTGVASTDPQMLKDAIAWSKLNNNGVFPADKYQFHDYPFGWSKDVASALPPEMSIVPAAKKIIDVSEGIPCIIGEWGYDIHPESNMGIRPFGGHSSEEIRSWWAVRSIFGFDAIGLESSYYYRLYQDYGLRNDSNSTIFETSSLFIKDDSVNIKRRLIGDAFKQISAYGDFVYDSTLAEDSLKVVYRFTNGKQFLYSGWTIEQFQLVTINGVNRAQFTERKINYTFPKGTRLDLQPGDTMAAQPFAGGSVELSSKPLFVLTTAISPAPIPVPTKTIYHKGYFTLNGKRINYTMYTDGSWIKTNSKYQPL